MEDGRPLNSIEPRLTTSDGQTLPFELQDGRLEARLPADASLLLAWNENGR